MKHITFLIAFFLASQLGATNQGAAPNIILIFTDDLGWGDVGVFFQNQRNAERDRSCPSFFTPNLDRLASEGVSLTDHYAAAPVCVSSRSSLLQGVTQGHASVRDNEFDKAMEENHNLATVLKQAGYATGAIGKWGLPGKDAAPSQASGHPLNQGFDNFFGYLRHIDGHEHYPKEMPYFAEKAKKRGPVQVWENRENVTATLDKCYTTDLFTARSKKWIVEHREHHPEQPFFLYLAYDTPHAVLELPTQAYPDGAGLDGGLQWLGTPGKAINTASGAIDSYFHPDYANATYDHDGNPNTDEIAWPDVYRRYATSVRRIDDCVGDLLDLLQDLEIGDNTLVVFTSDNGPSKESYLSEKYSPTFFAGFGPFDGIKRDCWEGGIRVPAIVHWPARIPSNRILSEPCATWDWLPTFADAAGLPAPARADGLSLLPLLSGEATSLGDRYLYFEYYHNGKTPDFGEFEQNHRNRARGQMQAIRQGDFMAVRYDIESADDDFEIYDVANDPKQTRNLASMTSGHPFQEEFKALALQSRRPNPSTPRPYDNEAVPQIEVTGTIPGLAWQSFEGDFPWTPSLDGLAPVDEGYARNLDVGSVLQGRETAVSFSGYIEIPAEGEYTFALSTDTGAILRLHQATLIDADFGYVPDSTRTSRIVLKKGLHPFSLKYRHDGARDPSCQLLWAKRGEALKPVPNAAFHSGHPNER